MKTDKVTNEKPAANIVDMTKTDTGKKDKPKTRNWNASNRKQGVWLKFYAEQTGCPADASYDVQMQYLDKACLQVLNDHKNEYHIDARIHNLDEVSDPSDPFLVSVEKPHAHLYFERKGDRPKLSTIFNDLKHSGIEFRKGIDDTMLDKQIEKGNAFPDYRNGKFGREYCVVYNSHRDMVSKNKGKHVYDTEDYHYTTFTPEQIDEMVRTEEIVNNGYSSTDDIKSMTGFEMLELMTRFRDLGARGGDFDEYWFNELPQSVRLLANKNKMMDEYDYGIDAFLSNPLNTDMTRLCLFIVGPKDIGKSGSMKRTCADLGLKLHSVSAGGGTGKMDNFKHWHTALGLDDTTVTGLMSYADDCKCRAYKRNKGNPINATKLLYITSNKCLTDFYWSTFGSTVPKEDRSDDDVGLDAFRSRFIEVTLDENGNVIDVKQWLRGSAARIKEKVAFASAVLENFKRHLKEYQSLKPNKNELEQITKPLTSLIDNDGFIPVPDNFDLPFDF